MGQSEVIEVLEKNKREMTAREISKEISLGLPTINRHLKQLSERGEIKRIERTTGNPHHKKVYCYFI